MKKILESLKISLLKGLLNIVLKRPSPDSVPRTGKAAKKVNCYSLYWKKENNPLYLFENFNKETLEISVKQWNEDKSKFEEQRNIHLKDTLSLDLEVRHFYGLTDITFNSIWDFSFNRFTKWIYTKVLFNNIKDHFFQRTYNLRKLHSSNRMDLLSCLVNDSYLPNAQSIKYGYGHLNSEGLSSWQIMDLLHGHRWWRHPLGKRIEHKIELYLESLVLSGDLKRDGIVFKINPQAIKTVEDYDENRRRHKDSLKIQRWIATLTFFIVLTGLFSVFWSNPQEINCRLKTPFTEVPSIKGKL